MLANHSNVWAIRLSLALASVGVKLKANGGNKWCFLFYFRPENVCIFLLCGDSTIQLMEKEIW